MHPPGWTAWLKRLIGWPIEPVNPDPAPALPAWVAWASEAPQAPYQARPLAGQMATQASLNPARGRKPARKPAKIATLKPRPVAKAVVKKAPVPRSVFLQARHLARKRPTLPNNVVSLPGRTTRPDVARALRIAA